jgi:hypothetical protein
MSRDCSFRGAIQSRGRTGHAARESLDTSESSQDKQVSLLLIWAIPGVKRPGREAQSSDDKKTRKPG